MNLHNRIWTAGPGEEGEAAAGGWVWHREGMWAVSTVSCLPVAEVTPLSQSSGWAALLEPSWCVGVQAWLLRKDRFPSIPKAVVLESRALLRLRFHLGVEQFENKIWEATLTRTQGGRI